MAALMNKYEVNVEGSRNPLYIQSHGVSIEHGVAIFYDVDSAGEKEVIYSFSSAYWNAIKLVE